MIACRKSFTDTLLELARQDKDIVAVTTDARGSVTLGDFAKELPAQFVECGIAGRYRLGKDDMIVDIVGNSHISVEDYAAAMIDELEHPKHHQERFTIGY